MIYLASPFTKYLDGPASAFYKAARLAGQLTALGHEIYSPIVHSYPLAVFGDLDPMDGELWQRVDAPFLAMCSECLVAQLKGWDQSDGVAHEIAEFRRMDKRVRYLNPVTLEIGDEP